VYREKRRPKTRQQIRRQAAAIAAEAAVKARKAQKKMLVQAARYVRSYLVAGSRLIAMFLQTCLCSVHRCAAICKFLFHGCLLPFSADLIAKELDREEKAKIERLGTSNQTHSLLGDIGSVHLAATVSKHYIHHTSVAAAKREAKREQEAVTGVRRLGRIGYKAPPTLVVVPEERPSSLRSLPVTVWRPFASCTRTRTVKS
jgi:hypothetical protein